MLFKSLFLSLLSSVAFSCQSDNPPAKQDDVKTILAAVNDEDEKLKDILCGQWIITFRRPDCNDHHHLLVLKDDHTVTYNHGGGHHGWWRFTKKGFEIVFIDYNWDDVIYKCTIVDNTNIIIDDHMNDEWIITGTKR